MRVNHIGSSAVKGLISKPTVDILLEITEESNMDAISDIISAEGWTLMFSQDDPYKSSVFNKRYTKQG